MNAPPDGYELSSILIDQLANVEPDGRYHGDLNQAVTGLVVQRFELSNAVDGHDALRLVRRAYPAPGLLSATTYGRRTHRTRTMSASLRGGGRRR